MIVSNVASDSALPMSICHPSGACHVFLMVEHEPVSIHSATDWQSHLLGRHYSIVCLRKSPHSCKSKLEPSDKGR